MNIEFTTVSAAADEDTLTDALVRQADYYEADRVLTPIKIGITGSAVIDDMEALDLYYGKEYIGSYEVTTIGVVVPLEARDMKDISPVKSVKWKDLRLFCREAPTTNQLHVRIVTR